MKLIAICKSLVMVYCVGAASSHAAWPDAPVRIVVPYAAGASGDLLLRHIQPALQEQLGQPVIVENRTGASGNIGTQEVVRARPDGHTLLLAATNNLVINQFLYRQMGFDPLQSLAPITKLAEVPSVLFVNAAVPSGSYAEFAQHARTRTGKLNFGSPGAGTTPHLSGYALSEAMGAGMLHIGYRGAAPAVQALLANDVQMLLTGWGVAGPQMASGKLRALAVVSNERLKAAPDVPTAGEAGMPGVVMSNWWGLAAPKGTDPAVIRRIADVFRAVLQLPSTTAFLVKQGFVAGGNSPEDFGRELALEAQQWKQLVRKSGVTVE